MRLSRILVAIALVVPLVIPASAGPALAQPAGSEVDFYTELTGANEVGPVVTDGTGIAAFHVRDTSLDFLVVTNGNPADRSNRIWCPNRLRVPVPVRSARGRPDSSSVRNRSRYARIRRGLDVPGGSGVPFAASNRRGSQGATRFATG